MEETGKGYRKVVVGHRQTEQWLLNTAVSDIWQNSHNSGNQRTSET